MEVGRAFSSLIKDRIHSYDFVEGIDYVVTLASIGEHQNVVMKEYHLTLGLAK